MFYYLSFFADIIIAEVEGRRKPPHFDQLPSAKEDEIMKRLFVGHIFLGRLASRTDDEFIDCLDQSVEVRPEALRWFCGMHDLESTFICQAL